jgi:hypothetical protein
MKTIALLLALGTAAVFAQGPLAPPPGVPAAGMKTLTQVEPRTPIETLPITISTSGSYYFTQNLQFAATSGDAISITSPNVTLDLGGFTLSSTAGVTGRGIFVTGGLNNVTIRNGKIAGNSTVYPTTIAGFDNGIYANASGGTPFGAFRNLTVEAMQVSGCRTWGIVAYYGSVTRCTVAANGTDGLIASDSVVTGCIAKFNGGSGLSGGTVTGCSAIANGRDGISAPSGSVTGCNAQGNNTSSGAYFDLNAPNAVIGSTKYGTGNVTGSSIDGERRTAIESLPYAISTSGSYYLAKSLQFTATSGDAISITSPNVTLDLGGFTLSSTAGVTGRGIFVTGGLNNVTIRNGKIAGNSSTVSPIATAGFDNGIYANASGGIPFGAFRNLTVEAMQVSGCRTWGIVAYYGSVTNCTVASNGSDGLIASDSIVTGCIAKFNGGNGLSGGTVTNCIAISNGGNGISGSTITSSTAMTNGQHGINSYSGSVTSCTATGNHTSGASYFDLNATDAVVAFTKYGTGNVAGSTLTGVKSP